MSKFQRNHKRVNISGDLAITVNVKLLNDHLAKTKIKAIEDISYAGIKVISPAPFKVGDDVSIQIYRNEKKECHNIVATLRRCEKKQMDYDLGLEFVTISKQDLQNVRKILLEAEKSSKS